MCKFNDEKWISNLPIFLEKKGGWPGLFGGFLLPLSRNALLFLFPVIAVFFNKKTKRQGFIKYLFYNQLIFRK